MRFGLFTCPYQRLPLETAFRDAADFGYDYIELWGGRPHAYAPDLLRPGSEELRNILLLSQKYSMPVAVYTPEHNAYPFNYMMGSAAQREQALDYLKSSLKAAKLLGAQKMLISVGHSGFASPEEKTRRLTHALQILAQEAEALNITVLLEALTPFESDFCTSLGELTDILNSVNSCAICGMCDAVVPFVRQETPADWVLRLGEKMQHLHLTDSDGLSENHLIPGDGCMDLRKALAELRQAGYDGNATLELVTHYMDRPSAAAKEIIVRIKELL